MDKKKLFLLRSLILNLVISQHNFDNKVSWCDLKLMAI